MTPERLVQYRFGKSAKVELAYPPSAQAEALLFAHYARYKTERSEVTFRSQGAEYTVFDYTEGRRREAGVKVNLAAGRQVTIRCRTPTIAGDLRTLEELLPCDPDNALNLNACAD